MKDKDRISIDLTGLRQRIENASSDPLWKELSLTKKVRLLLQERLDQIETQQGKERSSESESPTRDEGEEEKTIAQLVTENLNKLKNSGIKNLRAISKGEVLPTKVDFCKISASLGLTEAQQKKIWTKTYNNSDRGVTNGHS